jgi:NitT/TauT family transport system substrate-binding protein
MKVIRSVAVALVLAGLAASGVPRAGAQSLIPVHLVSTLTAGVGTPLYAQQAGIFRKYGLDVDVAPMSSGTAGMAAVIGGSANVVYANTLSLVEAHDRGIPLVVIAPGAYYNTNRPYAVLMVRLDSPVRTGRDLNGKVIGSSALRDINAITTMAWIDANGGDSKTVKTIEVANSALLPAIEQGRIEAATILPPFYVQGVESGKFRIIGKPWDMVAKTFEVGVWAASSDWAAKNPDVVRRFAAAMREAAAALTASPTRSVDLVAAFTKIDAAVVAKSPPSLDPQYVEPIDLQPVVDASLKFGLIQKGFDAATLLNPAVRRPER